MATKNKTKKKFKLFIAWDKSASDFLTSYGYKLTLAASEGKKIPPLPHDDKIEFYNIDEWIVDTKTFNTQAELNAYVEGVSDGNGWDNPETEQMK